MKFDVPTARTSPASIVRPAAGRGFSRDGTRGLDAAVPPLTARAVAGRAAASPDGATRGRVTVPGATLAP